MTEREAEPATEDNSVSFEELLELEHDHNQIDNEILRTHWKLSLPLFERRKALIARIPNFWVLVLEQGPPEVAAYIQPTDSRFFAQHLLSFDIDRFQLDVEPRSFSIALSFSPNEHFEDQVLEKKFYWRQSLNGWSGLVSEPVKIKWKPGKDLTHGLTDATCQLWQAFKGIDGPEKRLGFTALSDDPAYQSLKTKLGSSDFSSHSFFTLFTYVSSNRYVSADESRQAISQEAARREARRASKSIQEPQEDVSDHVDYNLEVTASPNGDAFADLLVEEIYTNAIKYFISAYEGDSEEPSEADFEEGTASDDASDDESNENSPSSLVHLDSSSRKRKSQLVQEYPKATKSTRT